MNQSIQTNQTPQEPSQNLRGATARNINTHFVLAVVAVCASCLTGFFAIPLALASLIFALRAQDLLTQGNVTEAARAAYWAGLFGWLTVIIAVLPIVLLIFFSGAILAGVAAFVRAM